MKDLILGGVVFIPGITLIFFLGFFLWLILRVAYTGLTGKYQYAGDIFDISMLFLCILVVHFIIN
ncbi:hypothetical protein [Providencia sp. Je.9.19]|uniref:hypothetical protein n=1 Tax=unclassified Providencia TaxID=2633465 RepID=UPI003DA9E509